MTVEKADGYSAVGVGPISLRCPGCFKNGTFDIGPNDFQIVPASTVHGLRRCPDPNCHTFVYVSYEVGTGRVLRADPRKLIDFDPTNVPAKVRGALEEAIQCHANQCYIAAAIMVRKTLEELCADRGVTGGNLKQRIEALGSKVVLPKELLQGLDELRLLGNNAAHIESKEYDKVGQEEVEVGIEFATEVLKATYQMSALLGRLRALKAQHEVEWPLETVARVVSGADGGRDLLLPGLRRLRPEGRESRGRAQPAGPRGVDRGRRDEPVRRLT